MSNDVIVQSIRFTFDSADADEAETILRELRDRSRREEGVLAFEVARSRDAPNVFMLWEAYADGAALDAHKATEHYDRLVLKGVRNLARERQAEAGNPI